MACRTFSSALRFLEVFHDVQYMVIVWMYNRARVERDDAVGGLMRLVFGRIGSLLRRLRGTCICVRVIALLTSGVSAERSVIA
jgi:hypothetical protein